MPLVVGPKCVYWDEIRCGTWLKPGPISKCPNDNCAKDTKLCRLKYGKNVNRENDDPVYQSALKKIRKQEELDIVLGEK